MQPPFLLKLSVQVYFNCFYDAFQASWCSVNVNNTMWQLEVAEDVIWHLNRNAWDTICCWKPKAVKLTLELSRSMCDEHPACVQWLQQSFHFSICVWYSCFGIACSYQFLFSCISAMSLYTFPFKGIFSMGNRKKLHGGQIDREPTTRMLCLAKNSLTGSAAGHSTWSRCRSEELVTIYRVFHDLRHNCRRWFPRSLWSKKFI